MGLFDDVRTETNCGNCQQLMEYWQTKAFHGKCLRKINYGEDIRKEIPECENNQTFEMHTFCDHCGMWHDAKGLVVDGIFTEVKDIKMRDKVYDFEERGLKKN